MPSFDVVSELDKHELTNAVENAVKELDRRYDLKGKGSFEFKEKDLTVSLTAEAGFQLEAMIEILKLALVKRKIEGTSGQRSRCSVAGQSEAVQMRDQTLLQLAKVRQVQLVARGNFAGVAQ